MVSLTSEKLASDQSQVVEDILTSENNGMGFFFMPLWFGGLPKRMKVNVSEVCWLQTTIES